MNVIIDDAQALATASDFAAELATGDSERDAQHRLPRAEVAALAASGLLGVTVPREHGGADVSARTMGELIATLSEGDASVGQIPQNHYFFVQVLREGQWPSTAATYGTNAAQLQGTVDKDSGRIIVTSAIDNLGKGAAGQVVQCANLMLGLPEAAGLTVNGVAP